MYKPSLLLRGSRGQPVENMEKISCICPNNVPWQVQKALGGKGVLFLCTEQGGWIKMRSDENVQ